MNDPEHYQRFPSMKPWEGSRYRCASSHKRLLVIGESHFLPESSSIHKSIDWYKADEGQLTDIERVWISTRKIIARSKTEGFKVSSHSIYKNIAIEVNQILSGRDDLDAIEDIAFYNYLQRPAITGDSLHVDPRDREVAIKVFDWVVGTLQPEIIIFTSDLAGQCCGERLRALGVSHGIVPHPTCAHWNMRAKKYGGLKGRELFCKILIEAEFSRSFVGAKVKAPVPNALTDAKPPLTASRLQSVAQRGDWLKVCRWYETNVGTMEDCARATGVPLDRVQWTFEHKFYISWWRKC